MIPLVLGAVCFILGLGVGGGYILRQVQSGRVVAGGRVYYCKDTGPVVR